MDVWQLIASQPLAVLLVVARTWLSIRFELSAAATRSSGLGPGECSLGPVLTASMRLLMSIARSLVEDRAHLYRFVVADGRRIGQPEFDDIDQGVIDGAATRLATLTRGEQFVDEFDFADR